MSGGELRFSVLGPVRAWRGDTELDTGSPQQRTILAMLLLAEGRQVGLGALQDALWDTQPPSSAASTVRTYVSRLRKSLRAGADADGLLSRASGYVLPGHPGMLDLKLFEQAVAEAKAARESGDAAGSAALLREALGLWQGTALAGLPGRWADAQRVRLEDLRLAALEERLSLDIDLGAHVPAAADLRELAETEPLRERLAELLMLALYRAGRQADALAAFTAIQRRLADELGIDPGPALRRMHDRILHMDQALIAPAGASSPATPAPPVVRPAQLPADLPAFAGREAELAQLDQLLETAERPGAAIATIGGMGGIGKTTLALRWAHRAADHFPDGQLYVNLRGFDPSASAVPVEEALRGFLAALGVAPQQVPDVPDTQAALYRSLLHGRRVLLVLDNARDAEQVLLLLPGTAGCVVLITSRSPLSSLITTHDVRPVALEPFTPDQSRGALGRRLGQDRLAASPAAVHQVIGHCAGLPLALAIVAARATTFRDVPLTVIASELGTAQTRLSALSAADQVTSVRAVFSWSYQQLTDRAAMLFRLLSVNPGADVSRAAAASLGGHSAALAGALLNELTAAHLITEHRPGRYALHDLLRAYAAELSAVDDSEPDRTAAFGRLADQYLHTAHGAHVLLRPMLRLPEPGAPRPGVTLEPLAGQLAAIEWFSAEQQVLQALIAALAARDGLRPYAWQLALRNQYYCQRQGYWHDWLTMTQTALAAALAAGDLSAQAYTRRSLAGAYRYLGRLDDAVTELERARELFEELGYVTEGAYLHANFAEVYRYQGRYAEAIEHARQAYDLHNVAGHTKGKALSCEILGSVLDELGRYEEAVSQFEQAALLYREMDDPRGEAHIWSGLGAVRQHQGRLREAVDSYRRSVEKARELGDRDVHADGLVGLGDGLLMTGDPASAHEAWHEALFILDDLQSAGPVTADSVRARLARINEPQR
jgi:DNA-binding SARP family transcriptional activator